ncbi:hypothetical protein UFOVP71_363 [uncultured Caudovirales phage]|uniref:NAT_SF domain containing protein n=1 Tax=uncultured Caudovirales phage TaxID=2100421 RepID=A0A6J5TA68_9CAUD|nr:hypothetical protein UFOVP71_363 [uncultured Caudovirales phage]
MRLRDLLINEDGEGGAAASTSTTSSDIASVSYPLLVRGKNKKEKRKNARAAVGQSYNAGPVGVGTGVFESAQVKFPITPEILKQAKESNLGFVYWGQAVPQAEASQCFTMINKTIESMLKPENCKFNLKNMRPGGNTLAIIPDDENNDFPVLECDYDTMITADGKIYHTVGIDAGYSQSTSKGFVTSLIAQLYKAMEFLHGPGQRTMAINDDKGAGVWQNIMSKLGAIDEPVNEDVMDEIGYDNSFNAQVERGGIILKASIVKAGKLVITAETKDGRKLGRGVFNDMGDSVEAASIDVDERYRRQGIASLIYDYAEELGNDVEPSDKQTDDGQAFWSHRRPEEQAAGVNEAKKLSKYVRIVKGPDTGKTGWIREIKHGAFKGSTKSYYVDLEGGGQANNLPGSSLRLIKDPNVAEAHVVDHQNVIYRLDPANPMTDTEVLVLGGAGRYTLQGLRDKARKEAKQLSDDLQAEHGGSFRNAAHNIKQLTNTLNTIVAAYNELKRIRQKGGRGSRGITGEHANFVSETYSVLENYIAHVAAAADINEKIKLYLKEAKMNPEHASVVKGMFHLNTDPGYGFYRYAIHVAGNHGGDKTVLGPNGGPFAYAYTKEEEKMIHDAVKAITGKDAVELTGGKSEEPDFVNKKSTMPTIDWKKIK